MNSKTRRFWCDAAALLSLAAFAFWMTRGLFTGAVTWDEGLTEYIPWRVEAARILARGEFPFFTPNVFAGMPLFATAYCGVLYPPNWLYLPLAPFHAAKVIEWLHWFLGGAGMYAYLRAHRLAWPATVLGAWCFVTSTFFLGHSAHISMGESALLAPWVVFLAAELLRRPCPRRAAAFAACLALQISAGYAQMVLMTVFWVGFEWLCHARRSAHFRRATLWLLGAGLLGFSLMALQILPSLEMAKETPRDELGTADILESSYPPWQLPTFFAPRIFGAWWENWIGTGEPPEIWITWSPLCSSLALAALALVLVRRQWRFGPRGQSALMLVLGIVVAFALSFGRYAPLNEWLVRVPPLGMFRCPARWLFLAGALTATLGAHGLHFLWFERARLSVPLLAGAWLGLAAASGVVILLIGSHLPGGRPGLRDVGTLLLNGRVEWLHLAAPLAFMALFPLLRRAPALLLLFLPALAVEARILQDVSNLPPEPWVAETRWESHPLLSKMDRPAIQRIRTLTPDIERPEALAAPGNLPLFWDVPMCSGYCPLLRKQLIHLLRLGQTGVSWRDDEFFTNPSAFETLGVSHVLVDESRLSGGQLANYLSGMNRHYRVAARAGDLAAVQLLHTRSRFDFASGWMELDRSKGDDALRDVIWSPEPPVAERYVLINKPDRDEFPPEGTDLPLGTIEVEDERNNAFRLRVAVGRPAVLLIRDFYWKGWKYRIAGSGEPFHRVYAANGVLRAIPVPAGEHTIEVRYDPPGWKRGLTISAASLLTLLGLCLVRRRRPLPADAEGGSALSGFRR
ncbi:hypothetical protein HZA57_04325 [Candidatus Poribacteria bacterium]|nr:hypothetical protein [Candidatus Poribacteria bacterium]